MYVTHLLLSMNHSRHNQSSIVGREEEMALAEIYGWLTKTIERRKNLRYLHVHVVGTLNEKGKYHNLPPRGRDSASISRSTSRVRPLVRVVWVPPVTDKMLHALHANRKISAIKINHWQCATT